MTRGSKGTQEGGLLASARKELVFIVSSSSNLQVNNGYTAQVLSYVQQGIKHSQVHDTGDAFELGHNLPTL